MAAKDTKDTGSKQETSISLSQAEMKLIMLGARFNLSAIKVDYGLLAKYGGYTKGSAQVLYRKALRKLIDTYPLDDEDAAKLSSGDDNAAAGPSSEHPVTPSTSGGGGGKKTPKTPRSRTSTGKKRKETADADQDPVAEGTPLVVINAASTPGAPGPKTPGPDDIETEPATPTKRPRKTPVKKTATPAKDEPKDEPSTDTD